MTWRRGFFRLWALFAFIWIIGSIVIYAPQGWAEWQRKAASDRFDSEKFVMLVPTDCQGARGRSGKLNDAADYEQRDGKCWYDLPTFRKLYSEYNDLGDPALAEALYSKAGMPINLPKPFRTLWTFLLIGVVLPLVVLGLGAALAWVLRGFQAST